MDYMWLSGSSSSAWDFGSSPQLPVHAFRDDSVLNGYQHQNIDLQWTLQLSQLAKTGYLQAGATILSTLLVARHLVLRSYSTWTRPEQAAATISFRYELCSQALRAASVASTLVVTIQESRNWSNVIILTYAFLLGLLRLLKVNDGEWRQVALHHVNCTLVVSCFLLLTGELLPVINIHHNLALSPPLIASIAALSGAVLVAFITPREWAPPPIDFDLPANLAREPSPEETCSWFQYYVTYEWLTPLLWSGARRQVTMDDLPSLPWYDEPLLLLRRVQEARQKNQSTILTVFRFLYRELITMSSWVMVSFVVELIAPFATYNLLAYLNAPEDAVIRPWVWLLLLFVGPLSRSVSFQQYIFTSTRFGVRLKAAFTQELYYKAMNSMELDDEVFQEVASIEKPKKNKATETTPTGRLANLMSSDIDAIARGRDLILVAAGLPAGTIISMIGLYRMLEWPALVGIAIIFVISPIGVVIAQRMVKIQREMRKIQDSRISILSEYLTSIRAIKYFAWENAVIKKVNEVRYREQQKMWKVNIMFMLLNEFTEAIPISALLVMFSLHVAARRQPLTAEVAFTSITLIRTLRRNINMVSNVSRGLTSAIVSIKRIDRYFSNVTPRIRHPVGPLRIEDATIRRHKNAVFTLKDVSLDFVEGGLNVITGPSGSGKSTLLLGILGETLLEKGAITCPKDIAYASQSPWLQNETIRENILFNSDFEEARYNRVINACGLVIDFDEFPERDQTEVGENGATLSGGQKSRVALARALYSKAPVLLLDDIFSALDAKTLSTVWEDCFCGEMLVGRTIVLVTQVPWVASQANFAVNLENGSVVETQQHLDIVRKPVALNRDIIDESSVDTAFEVKAAEDAQAANGGNTNETNGNAHKNSPAKSTNDLAKTGAARRLDEVNQEASDTGNIGRLQFLQYMKYFGHPLYAIVAVLMSALCTASAVGTGLWLAVWVDAYRSGDASNIAFYLGIYGVWSFSEIILTGFAFLVYEAGGWFAARTLHATFIQAVMSVPLSWYKTTPIGRVINRFSRDMSSIDGSLASFMRMFIESMIRLVAQVAAVGSVLPVFMLPAAVCCLVGVTVGEIYIRTVVVVKRLVSSSQSPLFSQFADSLSGMAIIRARDNMPTTFGHQMAEKLRIYERASESQFNCNRWMALRVDLATTLVSVAAATIAVSKAGTTAPGLVGFSLTNATTLSQVIILLVRSMNQLEVEMQSFYRVREFALAKPEEQEDEYKEGGYSDEIVEALPADWPRTGEVEFRNVTVKYDVDGPEILKDINLKFNAGERVAVVGRTGAGKSTLVLCLLRFAHIVSGQILFDGVDITTFPRRKLREALTIIPQEAVLFSGTVGSNLDPTDEIPEETVVKSLQYCSGIASFEYGEAESEALVDTSPNQAEAQTINLSTVVKAKGENFSHGQRQVLSLCRALVRKSKLMLLDEATASMDYETDQGIQAVLRKELDEQGGDRTLVTIAHRLKTIIDYDKVVVLGAGRVLEVGSPLELYNAQGQFYDMMRRSGEFEDLKSFLDTRDKE
ncbi:ATP-binding cassette transporter abc1 [Xylariales sp. PMI_506]|nr:ATP-binding cassette transporter abc1 [Xylariales sp. PMI_506]